MGNEPPARVWIAVEPPQEVRLKEFPRESHWDALVIGAGPNGLICALYLSSLGLKTLILERATRSGEG